MVVEVEVVGKPEVVVPVNVAVEAIVTGTEDVATEDLLVEEADSLSFGIAVSVPQSTGHVFEAEDPKVVGFAVPNSKENPPMPLNTAETVRVTTCTVLVLVATFSDEGNPSPVPAALVQDTMLGETGVEFA